MQATSIIKRKAELLLEYDQNNCLDRKHKLQKTGNEDMNIICWDWFQTARSQNIPLGGLMVQEKAIILCQGAGKFRIQSVKWVARIFPKTPQHYLRRSGRCFLWKKSMIGSSGFRRSLIATISRIYTTATRLGCFIDHCLTLTGHCQLRDNSAKAVRGQRNAWRGYYVATQPEQTCTSHWS